MARASEQLEPATGFYERVLGWTTSPVLVIDADYRMAYRGSPGPEHAAAGFDSGLAAGAFATAWVGDLLTGDLDAAQQRSDAAGGGEVLDRSGVPHMGEQILLRDPAGVPLRMWSPLLGGPADPENTSWTAVPYAELWSSDPALSLGYFADVFGLRFAPVEVPAGGPATWRALDEDQLSFVLRDAHAVPELGGSCWVPFFSCAAVAPCLTRAIAEGGGELPRHPSSGLAEGLRLGWCTDPDGLPIGFAARH